MGHAQPVYFDTLVNSKKLKKAGVGPGEAEAQAEALAEVFGDHIATKENINDLKHEINALRLVVHRDLSKSDARMDAGFAKMNTKMDDGFSKMDVKFSEFKADIIKWTIGLFIGQSALGISLTFTLIKFLH